MSLNKDYSFSKFGCKQTHNKVMDDDIVEMFPCNETYGHFNYNESTDTGDEYDSEQSGWSYLPDLIMERIFSYLSMRDKYWASMVCRNWYNAFHLPNSWANFVFDESTLTRRRYNYYSGWQYFLDHVRTHMCLSAVGKHFKVLEFIPTFNFHNMYDFMNMLAYHAEMQGNDKWTVEGVCSKVHTLKYTFPCNMTAQHPQFEINRLYGTGGKLLEMVKRLMRSLVNLRHLELIDLMLETKEALTLLDGVCTDYCTTLRELHLINPTQFKCQILHVGVFLNLQILVITPQNLGDDVIYLLGQTKLKHLHILQNRYSPVEVASISAKAWVECKKSNPMLRVHLTQESIRNQNLVWQEKAPVASVLFNSPQCRLDSESLARVMEWYGSYLRVYGYLGLPRYHQPKSFNERMDPLLLMLCKVCPNLNTLVIRERVSTSSLLLMAEYCPNLRWFFVRKNAVILRSDWPRNPDWSAEFYHWLKETSRSYQLTEQEISKKLKMHWKMLSDREFKSISVNLYQDL